MKACIIIPARMESTRFPGKPLALIGDMPMLYWTARQAQRVGVPVFVASDSQDILEAAGMFPAQMVRTGDASNGTERCALALAALGGGFDIVVNWQGDAPLIPHEWAGELIAMLRDDPDQDIATAAFTGGELVEGSVAVGDDAKFYRAVEATDDPLHVGLYAMRADALRRYAATAPSAVEHREGLEQLRWHKVKRVSAMAVLHFKAPEGGIREVNYPDDIAHVAATLGVEHDPV